MGSINKRVFYLFNLHYIKQASPQQIVELFSMLKDLDDVQLIQLMQNTWDDVDTDDIVFSVSQSQNMLSNILSDQHNADQTLVLHHK
ncbi:MAG: hypothetical protein ABIN91_03210 [Mucilaginibacter sp.]|uniref:hypothetical protein n=1 Tax=Mucilaginibacter sp. TaxID=1882438 RepID=UPI003267CAD5